jgi:hypothetical protein
VAFRRLLALLLLAVAAMAWSAPSAHCGAASGTATHASLDATGVPAAVGGVHGPSDTHAPGPHAPPMQDYGSCGCPMSGGCSVLAAAEVVRCAVDASAPRPSSLADAHGLRPPATPLLERADPPPRG